MKHPQLWMILGLTAICLTACAMPPVPTTQASVPAPIPIDFSTLQFPFDQDHGTINDVPRAIRDLDGKEVVIDGLMIPLDDHITQFTLVKSYSEHNVPTIQQTVVCKMPPGKSFLYTSDRLRVHGKMRVAIVMDGEWIVAIYTLDVDHVEPAPKPATSPSTRP